MIPWLRSYSNKHRAPLSRRLRRLEMFTCAAALVAITLVASAQAVLARPDPDLPHQTGRRLRVATMAVEPFVIVGEDGRLSGFSVELWEAIAAELSLDYEWALADTVEAQLEQIQTGAVDAAVSDLEMTPERERSLDFTHPYFDTGLQIMVRETTAFQLSHLAKAVFTPALFRVLGLGLLTLIVLAHLIWLIERGRSEQMPRSYAAGVWEATWWALHIITAQRYGEEGKPRQALKRLFVMFWMVAGVILIAQFTAAITASLAVQQITGGIGGPGDLPGKKVLAVEGTSAEDYLIAHGIRYRAVAHIDDAYHAVESGAADAVVFDAHALQYYARTQGRGYAAVVGPVFQAESYAIALPEGSELREPLNIMLLELKQSGRYQEIYTKWFGQDR